VSGLERLRLEVAAGVRPAADAVHADLSARTGRAMAVAEATGAPLLPVLDAVLEAEDDGRRTDRAVAVATAQTRAIVGGLLAAPVLLVPALQRLTGVELLGFYRTPVGLLVLVAGTGLLVLGATLIVALVREVRRPVTRRMPVGLVLCAGILAVTIGPAAGVLAAAVVLIRMRRRTPVPVAGTDEVADLVAAALTGGMAPAPALRIVAGHLPDLRVDVHRIALDLELGLAPDAPAGTDPLGRLRTLLASSDGLGVSVVAALRRLGGELRAAERTRVLAAAERLPAQLTFPTALCLLPGTLLLIGAPIVASGLTALGT
jgi:Flp pilus assembly protein TadB